MKFSVKTYMWMIMEEAGRKVKLAEWVTLKKDMTWQEAKAFRSEAAGSMRRGMYIVPQGAA